MSSTTSQPAPSSPPGAAPKRAGLVLTSLILGALLCNVNLTVANVALPDIGTALDATQTQITLIAVGCTLGLAMSVLYLGAIGDRYGRKLLLLSGAALTVPIAVFCTFAPSAELLIAGRILTGVAAGMAYPTTLALITALWGNGPARTKAIALWSASSAGVTVLAPIIAGWLLERYWWGSVFLIVVPVAVAAFIFVFLFVPGHVNESKDRVDNLGGLISVVMVAALVLGISTISAPGLQGPAVGLLILAVVFVILFAIRQRKASNPLYDLHYAARRLFWVPAVAGMIVFGSLMGSMFIGQQFMQNVLGYSTFNAGLAIVPAAVGMLAVAPRSAKLVGSHGSRFTLLAGYVFILPALLIMLLVWREGTPYLFVGLAYLLIGVGAGLALTPASHSLTGSVPVSRVGMASGTADLQRDLGGSIMQAIMGTALTFGYAASLTASISESSEASKVSSTTEAALLQSFTGAEQVADKYPQYKEQIVSAATESFLSGSNWAYAAAVAAVALGALLVATRFPGKAGEAALSEQYRQQDAHVAT
jgi:DHA2 family multidrug resistance protein-like MFS transporter